MSFVFRTESMKQLLCTILCLLGGLDSPLLAQAPVAGPSTLRVTVRDATDLGLPQAVVAIIDAQGVAQQAAVDRESVATFTGLQPGAYQVTVTADGFREQVLQ
ncbi:MAG TPA: carboxypeptidase-like regulatory domain-containing protein, partial [Vicinamibacterales bacterium]|nr:carboxypeptidase-like regulatory domain-containing protein [Vicinamibacterales bacterium]